MIPPTTGPHFLIAPDAVEGDRAELLGDDARHLAVVLRTAQGAPVSLADGHGALYHARVAAVSPDRVRLAITARHDIPLPATALTVVHALPKGRKLDDVVQRLTEIGVDRLVPVHSARSQVHLEGARAAKAVARWRAVAAAAAKQSRRTRLLEITEVGDWATAFPTGVSGVVAWEDATAPLRDHVDTHASALWMGIGPEGGLTPEEVASTGLPAVSLGETVLRTETAALVAATMVLSAIGRLG